MNAIVDIKALKDQASEDLKSYSALLAAWFALYGASPTCEIEARVKNVDAHVFTAMKRQLESNPVGFAAPP